MLKYLYFLRVYKILDVRGGGFFFLVKNQSLLHDCPSLFFVFVYSLITICSKNAVQIVQENDFRLF